MTGTSESGTVRHRPLAAAGAAGAAAIALLFATVGDGVDARADGLAGTILDHGHTATWVLLASALGLTAWGRGPRRLPRTLGWAGLGVYLTFLLTLLLHDPA